jgi:predicted DNA-binding ribbon-helix-helix protein
MALYGNGDLGRSPVIKRSISINGHNTSICLEDQFYDALCDIADETNETVEAIVSRLDTRRKRANLSAHLRCFILDYFQQKYESRQIRKAVGL